MRRTSIVPTSLVLISSFFYITCGQKLHEYMTKREVKLLFNQDPDTVHKVPYQVVPIVYKKNSKRETRSEAELKLTTSKKKYSLYLEENENQLFDHHTALYLARKNNSEISYELKNFHSFVSTASNIERYQETESRAAVTVSEDEYGMPNINGVIGDEVIIHSLPVSIKSKCLNDSFKHTDLESFCDNSKNYHIIIDTENQDQSEPDIHLKNAWDILNKNRYDIVQDEDDISLRALSDDGRRVIAHPELLIVVDYETFELHDKDFTKLATYMATFWNAVDLRFRQMKRPEMRWYITALVVPVEKDVEPYLKFESKRGYTFYSGKTLADMGNYFYNKFYRTRFHPYDIVVGILNKHILSDSITALGYSFIGEACKIPRSVSLIKDQGGYIGVITATHELGHLLGAKHDGQWTTKDCPEKGYLMGPMIHDAFHWSICSMNSIEYYISRNGACLMNKPNFEFSVKGAKKLPGKLMSRDEQCSLVKSGSTSINNEDCHRLTCEKCFFLFIGCYNNNPLPPAEGSSCGENKICLDSECVDDPGIY